MLENEKGLKSITSVSTLQNRKKEQMKSKESTRKEMYSSKRKSMQ